MLRVWNMKLFKEEYVTKAEYLSRRKTTYVLY